MIKNVIHIDKTYPRKLNGVAANTTISKSNWGFDTEGTSLEGNISEISKAALKTSDIDNNDYNVDELFDNDKITQTQLNNIESDGNGTNQIRFNANIFNYKVHAIYNDVILKYDSPVCYDILCNGTSGWVSKLLQLKSRVYDYQIAFDILAYDPIGIDAYAYEGYVRGQLFAQVLRDKTNSSDVNVHDKAVYWTDPDTAVSTTVAEARKHDKYIYSGNHVKNSNQLVDELEMRTEVLPDMYDDENKSFKLHISISGSGYETDEINTSEEKRKAFEDVMANPDSTEDQIIAAWNACEGIKYKFFDVAGNVVYWVMPYLEIIAMTLEEMYDKFTYLDLTFIDTYPENLDLSTDLEGKTTVKVRNPFYELTEYPTIINLDKDSIGKLYPSTKKHFSSNIYSKTEFVSYDTELVDNINESGWVIAHAYVDVFNFFGALEFVKTMIKNRIYTTGTLGEWIKECADNSRKINLQLFVPQYIKTSTTTKSEFNVFVDVTEKFINRMYKSCDKNCYISVLEAVSRIGDMNDPYYIYGSMLDLYDDDHGDMLHIKKEILKDIADIDRGEADAT